MRGVSQAVLLALPACLPPVHAPLPPASAELESFVLVMRQGTSTPRLWAADLSTLRTLPVSAEPRAELIWLGYEPPLLALGLSTGELPVAGLEEPGEALPPFRRAFRWNEQEARWNELSSLPAALEGLRIRGYEAMPDPCGLDVADLELPVSGSGVVLLAHWSSDRALLALSDGTLFEIDADGRSLNPVSPGLVPALDGAKIHAAALGGQTLWLTLQGPTEGADLLAWDLNAGRIQESRRTLSSTCAAEAVATSQEEVTVVGGCGTVVRRSPAGAWTQIPGTYEFEPRTPEDRSLVALGGEESFDTVSNRAGRMIRRVRGLSSTFDPIPGFQNCAEVVACLARNGDCDGCRFTALRSSQLLALDVAVVGTDDALSRELLRFDRLSATWRIEAELGPQLNDVRAFAPHPLGWLLAFSGGSLRVHRRSGPTCDTVALFQGDITRLLPFGEGRWIVADHRRPRAAVFSLRSRL